ncbi:hypothetical protein CPB84DRAFT_1844975 [Gymnopilus junonius]|uniref:Uncharacterized protein n=1 Tax=Gymnopilus junonius TaxID=109634 RepID=A0A9P5NVT8_GYMJU|nr:hypothetical protein CPB84DRAFT_1844975 [Gymnopilus junonius]
MSMPNTSSPSYQSLTDVNSLIQSETDDLEHHDEDDLTEAELREIYDREEIDRFLHLFYTFVTEVHAPEAPSSLDKVGGLESASQTHVQGNQPETRPSVDSEWTPIPSSSGENVQISQPAQYGSLSEEIACRYLVPILPYPRAPTPSFTIGRLRVTLQRLYLAVLHVHKPFFERLLKLATWEEHRTSLIYCTVFWILWWHNFLVSALVLRILVSLLKRRIFPYPTLSDLRRHREEVSLASDFGKQVADRLSASSFGITETWRLLKLIGQTQKSILKGKTKEKIHKTDAPATEAHSDVSDQQGTTVLDDPNDSEETKDLKRIGLQLLNEMADLHERIRNIIIWRRPEVSRRYGFILTVVSLITLFPTQYTVKLVFFALGFAFWHITPILAAMPPSAWERIPPPFSDAPTDAEYAMELISRRVAAGLQIEPSKSSRNSRKKKSTDSVGSESDKTHGSDNSVDWKKWGDRLAFGKSAVRDIKRLKPESLWTLHESWPPRHPIIPGAIGIAQPASNVETRTYPCQHSSVPGLITLTQEVLFFTPLMSHNAKLVIPLTAVKGVKKAGLLKGLLIRWTDSSNDRSEQKEERFTWIGGRDELFAHLVGSSGARWMKV